jgi:hypothetical protein
VSELHVITSQKVTSLIFIASRAIIQLIRTLFWQETVIFIVEAGGTYSYRCVLEGFTTTAVANATFSWHWSPLVIVMTSFRVILTLIQNGTLPQIAVSRSLRAGLKRDKSLEMGRK